jgi:predicted metal-dependent phosphoesterase TrpH
MTRRLLLCELHAHTTWSDGTLTLREVVDLYGRHGFDVLCVTDHAVPPGDPYLQAHGRAIDEANWQAYREEIQAEAERARREYGLVLVRGVELSENHADPDRIAHAVALGLERLPGLEGGVLQAMVAAAREGAAVIAAHPYDADGAPTAAAGERAPARPTRRLWRRRHDLTDVVHAWELFNQNQAFPWVADERLPAVATGDFHRIDHFAGWKTMLPCAPDAEAVVECLRRRRGAHLVRFDVGAARAVATAA